MTTDLQNIPPLILTRHFQPLLHYFVNHTFPLISIHIVLQRTIIKPTEKLGDSSFSQSCSDVTAPISTSAYIFFCTFFVNTSHNRFIVQITTSHRLFSRFIVTKTPLVIMFVSYIRVFVSCCFFTVHHHILSSLDFQPPSVIFISSFKPFYSLRST